MTVEPTHRHLDGMVQVAKREGRGSEEPAPDRRLQAAQRDFQAENVPGGAGFSRFRLARHLRILSHWRRRGAVIANIVRDAVAKCKLQFEVQSIARREFIAGVPLSFGSARKSLSRPGTLR
jgi:hypothetical protein